MPADSLSLNPGLGHSLLTEAHCETRYVPSAWTLLNHAKSAQALLSTSSPLSESETQRYSDLLASYHAVYRPALLRLRASGYRGACPPPTPDQLREISLRHSGCLTPQQVELELQTLANQLLQR